MDNRVPIEITELQAKETADEAADRPRRAVFFNAGGKVRHLDEAELMAFLAGLMGKGRH